MRVIQLHLLQSTHAMQRHMMRKGSGPYSEQPRRIGKGKVHKDRGVAGEGNANKKRERGGPRIVVASHSTPLQLTSSSNSSYNSKPFNPM